MWIRSILACGYLPIFKYQINFNNYYLIPSVDNTLKIYTSINVYKIYLQTYFQHPRKKLNKFMAIIENLYNMIDKISYFNFVILVVHHSVNKIIWKKIIVLAIQLEFLPTF